jgi:hypothetical protein
MTGYNSQKLAQALGGHFRPGLDVLQEALKEGYLLGLVGIDVSLEPAALETLMRNNILILDLSGAASGVPTPEAAECAGAGLKAFCELSGLAPILKWEGNPEPLLTELLANPELKPTDFPFSLVSQNPNPQDIISYLRKKRSSLKWKEVNYV